MTVLANIGVPMLFVQLPLMIIALPVVILIEAALCKRWFSMEWKPALKATSVANAVSTLVGFPFMWLALVVVQMVLGGGSAPKIPDPWFSIYTVTVQAPWLLPYENKLYWMVPTACLSLLVPAFFVTVWIERQFYRRSLQRDDTGISISAATWRMHIASYAFLFIAGLGLLAHGILNNKSEQGGNEQSITRTESKGPS
jgi:hypothetical protein